MKCMNSKQTGFTILELTLAMTFLSFVLIFSSTIVMQMSQTYIKGLTMKQINQAGRTVADDITRSFEGSINNELNIDNLGNGYMCMGNTVYIWNPVYLYNEATGDYSFNAAGINRYSMGSLSSPISLARVTSDAVGECVSGVANPIPSSFDNLSLLGSRSRIIAATQSRSSIDIGGGIIDDRLVKITFVIGTFDSTEVPALAAGGASITSGVFNSVYDADPPNGRFQCKPGTEGNFCSFGTFETTVYIPR